MSRVGVAEQISEDTLDTLYPDEITRHALVRAVNRHEREGDIDAHRAVQILLLGEPAIYGVLSELPKL